MKFLKNLNLILFFLLQYNKQREVLIMNVKYESEYRKLGLKIAYYRKLRGFTQEQLAEMLVS